MTQFRELMEDCKTVAEEKKRKEKKKFGEHLAAENPNRVTALSPPLGPFKARLFPDRKVSRYHHHSRLVAMYAQRPLAYAPTPYSYTPNPTLTASINLDEVLCSGGALCDTAS